IAVVDPGVGGARRGIVLTAGGHALVGPDNGLLAQAAALLTHTGRGNDIAAVVLDSRTRAGRSVSQTFHGRDVFAPAAAALASGAQPGSLGHRTAHWEVLTAAPPRWVAASSVEVKVLHVDRFGNAVTNLSMDEVGGADLEARNLRGRDVRSAN